ncbi:hypothetical protein KKG83_04760, partial [Candidatus Micrarchaeota archaeon]|nr:hypothetical protein [Candidatus Micrarchaeota archaeon]
GSNSYLSFDALQWVNALFAGNPGAFVRIAKAAGPYSGSAFNALFNEDIALLFESDPDVVVNAFVEIAHAAGEYSDGAFIQLLNKKIGSLFAGNPDAFVEIAKAAKENSRYAFGALQWVNTLFAGNPDAFVEISKAAGVNSASAFYVLRNESVAVLFESEPDVVVNAFVEIAKAAGLNSARAFYVLNNERVAGLFADNPGAFVEIANIAGSASAGAFSVFLDERAAVLFESDPEVVVDAFVKIADSFKGISWYAFNSLETERIAERFWDYCNTTISFDQFKISILSSDSFAIENGRPLDDLHFNQSERELYLASLSDLEVFALLNSNPGFIYTSSNHMLFDRLKEDLGTKSITELFEEYGLIGTGDCRNFLFRAITYDRFYGKEDSLLEESDVKALLPTLLEPLNSEKFDKKYFFLLANALDDIKNVPEVIDAVKQVSEKRLQEGIEDKELKAGFEVIAVLVDEETSLVSEEKKILIRELEDKKAFFDPNLYKNNGKITVLQVFDKEDTGKDHWFMTQDWFTAYFGKKPVTETYNELVYENADVKMILFMSDAPENRTNVFGNQEFIREQLQKTPNMIVAFRGESRSFLYTFPYGVFGNIFSHILFIPGVFGSLDLTPQYIYANPETDLRFISNTSTGNRQVTNAIVEALIESEKKTFRNVIADSVVSIEKTGGDVSTIKVFSSGDLLLNYVLEQTKE